VSALRRAVRITLLGCLLAACARPAVTTPTDAGPPPVALPAPAACTGQGVCWRSPLPQGNDLAAVWGASSTEVWAVGRSGTILRWDGAGWRGTTALAAADLHGVHGSGPADVWAVGNHGVIEHWDGRAWSRTPTPARYELTSVWAESPTAAWAVGQYFEGDEAPEPPRPARADEEEDEDEKEDEVAPLGIILRWDGKVWAVDRRFAGRLPALDSVCGLAADDVWASGGLERSRTVHWNGRRWSLQPVKAGRSALSCPRGGSVWTLGGAQVGDGFRALWANGDGEAWAVGEPRQMAHRTGGRWSLTPTTIPGELRAVWGAGRSDVWAVGEAGAIAHWNGADWRLSSGGERNAWRALWGTADDDVWATGAGGTSHWDGVAWALKGPAASAGWSIGRDDAWLAAGEALQHWDGSTWSAAPALPEHPPLNAVWGSAANEVWAAGDGGALLRWNGSAWGRAATPATRRLTAVSGTGPANLWIGGERGFIGRWDGGEWRAHPVAEDATVLALRVVGPEEAWALTSVGPAWQIGARRILHWTGAAWTELPLPPSPFLRDLWGLGRDELVVASTTAFERWDGHAWRTFPLGAQDGFVVLWASATTIWGASATGGVLSLPRE
jgi:hypothetical protein